MIEILKKIKQKNPFVWYLIEYTNGCFVSFLFGNRIKRSIADTLSKMQTTRYCYRVIDKDDLCNLALLLNNQPHSFDKYFKPHGFDIESLDRLYKNQSFLMLGAFDDKKMIGYFFIRFFFKSKGL